ncbi:VOC family protein [Pinisolibacter sp.]|uniref:VOC family protein n=1 Tax=Pinisolibacter sp. TaxID=2172024 RepID=UPI002FDDE7D6
MSAVAVTELGYMGISVSDALAWKDYARDIVGMEIVDEGEGDRFYLRMDSWHHRMVVHVGDQDDLAYLGWRVAGPDELDAMAAKLDAAGYAYRVASASEAAERRVLGLIKLADPGGNPTEIFWGPEHTLGRPFHPGRPMHGRFVTGDQQGFAHCLLRQDDDVAAYKFYRTLGLRGGIEYHLPLPDGAVAKPIFMHCNDRQHSVAFGLGPMPKRINHLMIEYSDLDDLGIAHDLVRQRQIPVAMQLGKHSNDKALTFYHASPSGWLWELGWGGSKPASQQAYYKSDVFGHGLEASGFGLDVDLGAAE